MRLRDHVGSFLAILAAAAGSATACTPNAGLPPATATSTGGGEGGSAFDPRATCSDPTDSDGDGVADRAVPDDPGLYFVLPIEAASRRGTSRFLRRSAAQTSIFSSFGGSDRPLVPQTDTLSAEVSGEVVGLIGLLAGAGLHDVTTAHGNYDCAGGADCTGDGIPDLEYHNPVIEAAGGPFDGSRLVTAVAPIESPSQPPPYSSLDAATFHDVPGDTTVTFRVHAKNEDLKATSLVVLRAIIRVVTPAGQLLGGAAGIKLAYFVIPEVLTVPG